MRMPAAALALALSASVAPAQVADLPADIGLRPNSAVPRQQWPGDNDQIYEPFGRNVTYYFERTNAQAMSGPNKPGVWGHDEGPSALLATGDGRILWMWGDSVTAYQDAGTPACAPSGSSWCSFQNSSYCQGTSGPKTNGCIGVDTVGFIASGDVPKLATCVHLAQVDGALIAGTTPTTDYSSCATMTYIIDPAHATESVPVPNAGFTYEHATGLNPTNEDMLAGHTATGPFVIDDYPNPSNLYVLYQVQSQPTTTGSLKYTMENILLTHTNTSLITSTGMPQLAKTFPISQAAIPTGQVWTSGTNSNVYACPSSSGNFNTDNNPADPGSWLNTTYWQGISIMGVTYAVQSVNSASQLAVVGTPPGTGGSTTCATSTLYNMLPTPDNNPGEFMFVSPEVIDPGALGLAAAMPWLPAGAEAVCFWGSGFEYRASNVYLGCMQAADSVIAGSTNTGAGVSSMYYFSGFSGNGAPIWNNLGAVSNPEALAVPLLTSWNHGGAQPTSPCVGELSVRWIPPLGRFLMTYGSFECGGLWYRTSPTPWGPWTVESRLFWNAPNYGWEQALVYLELSFNPNNFNLEPAVKLCDPVLASRCQQINVEVGLAPYDHSGNAYAPYQYPGSTSVDNGDGTVTVFMNLSGYNPYVTWQMSARFIKHPSVRITPGVRVVPGVQISD